MIKIFSDFKLTWPKLTISAAIIGILVAIINRIPFLENTSFQDIAIVLDVWIVFGIIIAKKSQNALDSALKCFAFFLISQPIIYFVEAVIDVINGNNLSTALSTYFNNYYFSGIWFRFTLLTLPGGYVAYFINKQNIASALILSVATGYLGYAGVSTLLNCFMVTYPNHIISGIFCLVAAVITIFAILKKNSHRLIAGTITVICAILGAIFYLNEYNTPGLISIDYTLKDGTIASSCYSENEEVANVFCDESNAFTVKTSQKHGTTTLHVFDTEGREYVYTVKSVHNDLTVEPKL